MRIKILTFLLEISTCVIESMWFARYERLCLWQTWTYFTFCWTIRPCLVCDVTQMLDSHAYTYGNAYDDGDGDGHGDGHGDGDGNDDGNGDGNGNAYDDAYEGDCHGSGHGNGDGNGNASDDAYDGGHCHGNAYNDAYCLRRWMDARLWCFDYD